MSLSRPRKIIDLDASEQSQWKIDSDAIHIFKSKTWLHEPVGCILCAEAARKDALGQTLQNSDNEHEFICLTHGDLEEVPYEIQRITKVRINDKIKENIQDINQFLLFPINIDIADKEAIIERLIESIVEVETEDTLGQ